MTLIRYDLRGKRVLVTGAAGGIGLAVAEMAAEAGASVALNDLPTNDRLFGEVERLRGLGLNVIAVPGDIGAPDTATAMTIEAAVSLGGLDFVINNAGAPGTKKPIPMRELDRLTPEFWDKMLSINLLGAFFVSRAAVPYLRAVRGAIVNTASDAAFSAETSSMAYAAAKAALVHLTGMLARGLAPEIRVNAIAPGMVNSGWECSFGDQEMEAKNNVPLARVGEPREYAELILFLAAGASYVTGETIVANGGSLL